LTPALLSIKVLSFFGPFVRNEWKSFRALTPGEGPDRRAVRVGRVSHGPGSFPGIVAVLFKTGTEALKENAWQEVFSLLTVWVKGQHNKFLKMVYFFLNLFNLILS